jgi:glucose-1-phosphate thymidylyltransferase
MKALILAAGYATRLYPLTLNKPKPLLSVGEKLVIEYIIERIGELEEIDEIFIVTNQKFFSHFEMWLKNFRFSKKIEILNDGTVSNVDRLGAIRDIEFVITRKRINCNLLIIAGDNLFENSLQDFVRFSQRKIPSMSIGLYDVRDKELAKKFGVVEIDKDNQIIDFQEKPLLPKSSLVAKCLYFFPKEKIGLINQYLKEDKNVKDAPGYYIEWLVKREKVFGFVFRGRWYDIGDISSYEEAKQAYEK